MTLRTAFPDLRFEVHEILAEGLTVGRLRHADEAPFWEARAADAEPASLEEEAGSTKAHGSERAYDVVVGRLRIVLEDSARVSTNDLAGRISTCSVVRFESEI